MQIIHIKPNQFMFDRVKYFENKELLKKDIMEIIEVIDIDDHELMYNIVSILDIKSEKTLGNTSICYENENNIYELCYVGVENMEDQKVGTSITKEEDQNNLASFLCGENVSKNGVFFSSKISDNSYCVKASVTIDEFIDILYSKFVHVGIVVFSSDGNKFDSFTYFEHPSEYYRITEQSEFDKFEILSVEMFGFGLTALINKEAKEINRSMTRFFNKRIYGDVLLIAKTDNAYYDLSLDTYTKLNALSYQKLENRDIIVKDEQVEDGKLQKVINRWIVLDEKYKNYKPECTNCHKYLYDIGLVCGGCFHARYDCVACQHDDWRRHKDECLHRK